MSTKITIVAVLAAACAVPLHSQTRYSVSDTGPLRPYHDSSYATAINNAGQAVGFGFQDNLPRREAFIWDRSVSDKYPGAAPTTDLGNLHGLDFSYGSVPWFITNNGLIAGQAGTHSYNEPDEVPHAVIWQHGSEMVDLGTLGGPSSAALAVNENAVAVGWSEIYQGSTTERYAFIWDPENGMRGLNVGPGQANAINRNSEVVGLYFLEAGRHAFYWNPESGIIDIHDYVTLGGSDSEAWAINDRGQIVGSASDENGISHAFFLDTRTGDIFHLNGDFDTEAFAINARGVVVGKYAVEDGVTHPFVWDAKNDRVDDLNDLIDPGWTLLEAWGINDAGQIVGFGSNPEYVARGFVLSPARDHNGEESGQIRPSARRAILSSQPSRQGVPPLQGPIPVTSRIRPPGTPAQ